MNVTMVVATNQTPWHMCVEMDTQPADQMSQLRNMVKVHEPHAANVSEVF